MAKKRRAEDDLDAGDRPARKANKKKSSIPVQNGWEMSPGVGGSILNIDPVFSADGETILIPYRSSVGAFSTKTSLLLRNLHINDGMITGLAAVSPDSKEIIISSSSGKLEKWDWSTGSKVNSYESGRPIHALTVLRSRSEDGDISLAVVEDSIVAEKGALAQQASHSQRIAVHCLNKANGERSSSVVFENSTKISELKSYGEGKLIVASSGNTLLVGRLREKADTDEAVSYKWYQLPISGEITCFDVKPVSRKKLAFDANVAVGTGNGPIYLYNNLVSSLIGVAKKGKAQPTARKLHWHRFAVATVRFSKDDGYLVSGGIETVLCSWQLETGRRQDLPHLTAPIKRLAISTDGASYAVVLGNNSLIVLSTLDFKPTFAVTGLVIPVTSYDSGEPWRFPVVVKPGSAPGQLLFATPSSTDGLQSGASNAVYLQSIDIRTGTQLEKQALTRANVTDFISDPSGKFIEEPCIEQMALSPDGKWLATVETWIPPSKDQVMACDDQEQNELAEARSEVYLKFWKRNEQSKTWELSARIENPHARPLSEPGHVADLAATSRGFYTIGSDGQVKVWRQTLRRRNNVQVKDKSGAELTNWLCTSSIAMPPAPIVESEQVDMLRTKLAVSEDDSLLVAVLQSEISATICTVSVDEGKVMSMRVDSSILGLHAVAILDKYLIVLADDLLVWDLERDELQFGYSRDGAHASSDLLHNYSHLAVQPAGTFAIAVPDGQGDMTSIAVFKPSSDQPLTLHRLSSSVRSLLPSPSSGGYIVVDNEARVCQLTLPGSASAFLPQPVEKETNLDGEDAKESDLALRTIGSIQAHAANGASSVVGQALAASNALVTQAGITTAFEGIGADGAGGANSIFRRVAQMVVGK